MRKTFFLLASLWASFGLWAQPTDNPYKSRYGGPSHWTDSLAWTNVFNANTFGALGSDTLDDSAAIANAIQQIYNQGGGVLFFPPGTYYFSGNLKIKSGVVLRGESPVGITDARTTGYALASKMVFPKFVYDTSANNNTGNDRRKSFRGIKGEFNCSNAGLVNLDINRAYIGFHPRFNTNPSLPHTTPQAIEQNRNIIVYGCRSNNAVIIDGGVPDLGTPAGSRQRPWQLFPWRFSANIDVYVYQNCVIANNRLNDGPFDDFEMPNYKIRQRNTNNWITLGMRTVGTGWKADFDYNAHYGISLNRAKIYEDSAGRYRIHGVVTYGTPETEPELFCTGFEIRDNWVYKTSRIGITAAGIGLIIKGNITKDRQGKDTPAQENFLGPTGTTTPQGATTLENRGIDFSGWQVLVDSNQVEAVRNYVQGYLSTDGEGILLQECCGGTQVNDYTISNNITKNYIGIYKMRDINNLKILNNNMNNDLIYIVANTNGNAYFLNNFIVEGNQQVGSIQATGSRGGVSGYVRNNVGNGNSSTRLSCHVNFEANNTGFAAPVYEAIDPNQLANTSMPSVPGPCAESTVYPKIDMTQPSADTTYDQMSSYTLKAKLIQGDLFAAKADFYLGTTLVAENLSFDIVDSTASYTWTVPSNPGLITAFTARIRDQGFTSFSPVRKFTRVTSIISLKPNGKDLECKAFPNPIRGNDNLTLHWPAENGRPQMSVFDAFGKKLEVKIHSPFAGQSEVLTSSLKPGFYFLQFSQGAERKLIRIVKQ
jgi:hypothetical protein